MKAADSLQLNRNSKYRRVKAKLELGIDARALEMQRDLNRDGKRLTN